MSQAVSRMEDDTDRHGGHTPSAGTQRGRIDAIDVARAVALVAMAVYHFTWDLEFFSYVAPGLTSHGAWRIFARVIASSFLVLVGVSLVLAHDQGIRWPSFFKRLGQIVAGGVAVTVVTSIVTPTSFVYFGILQQIAVASCLGLLFLPLPWPLTLLAAAGTVALPYVYTSPFFDPMWLDWTGLYTVPPDSNDFVPIFPFFGAVLAGIALSGLLRRIGGFAALRRLNPSMKRLWPAVRLGRHSLLFYLVHQPVLIALVFAFSQVFPPDVDASFTAECHSACVANRDAAFCARYCTCAEGRLKDEKLFEPLMRNELTKEQFSNVHRLTTMCAVEAEPGD